MEKVAMAIAAHPDDIEFMMGGTLILLKEAGYDVHYMNLSTGDCGSLEYDASTTAEIREKEAQKAAKIIGATYHPPICNDFEILYRTDILKKLASVIREVQPSVVLTHSPSDYMEDHMNTSRLAVSAAFVRGIPNYETEAEAVTDYDCTVYHALPHGLSDPLGREVIPEIFIDNTSVQSQKMEALRAHESQQNWLEESQKMNSYLKTMKEFSLEVGRMSKKFKYAEGWRRRIHYGFCDPDDDPLRDLGEHYLYNQDYS